MQDPTPMRRYRAVFISDVHLGQRGCQAELLLDFIRTLDCEHLYLVGDIVDGWRLKRGWFWPQAHNDVVQKLLRLARKGVEVTYIPGNHDDRARDFCGVHFGGVVIAREAVHTGVDGRRYLVTHGDAFDDHVHRPRWAEVLGDWIYRALVRANTGWARLRRRRGLGYWSLAAHVKSLSGGAARYVDGCERFIAADAKARGFDGVICGHIHHPAMREIDGVLYINDGDWVESCTAAVEHLDGRIELVRCAGWTPAASATPRVAILRAAPQPA